MRSNWSGRFTTAFETIDGRAVLIRYRVPFNRYYTYVTRWGMYVPNLLEAVRIHEFFVCVTFRVKYCVRQSTTSNISLLVTKCRKVTEEELNEMLSGCPRRNYIRIPWRRLRRRTRREVMRECSRWWFSAGVKDVENYLDDIAEELEDEISEYVSTYFTGELLNLIGDYAEWIHEVSLKDETYCRLCRCEFQTEKETRCVDCPGW